MTIKIMNLRQVKPTKLYDVRIDRSSPLGNQFFLSNESERDIVCDKYEKWFNEPIMKNPNCIQYQELQKLLTLHKKYGKLRLFCWCAPKRCHGETIKQWLEDQLK